MLLGTGQQTVCSGRSRPNKLCRHGTEIFESWSQLPPQAYSTRNTACPGSL